MPTFRQPDMFRAFVDDTEWLPESFPLLESDLCDFSPSFSSKSCRFLLSRCYFCTVSMASFILSECSTLIDGFSSCTGRFISWSCSAMMFCFPILGKVTVSSLIGDSGIESSLSSSFSFDNLFFKGTCMLEVICFWNISLSPTFALLGLAYL